METRVLAFPLCPPAAPVELPSTVLVAQRDIPELGVCYGDQIIVRPGVEHSVSLLRRLPANLVPLLQLATAGDTPQAEGRAVGAIGGCARTNLKC
jgi:hypothetical protein